MKYDKSIQKRLDIGMLVAMVLVPIFFNVQSEYFYTAPFVLIVLGFGSVFKRANYWRIALLWSILWAIVLWLMIVLDSNLWWVIVWIYLALIWVSFVTAFLIRMYKKRYYSSMRKWVLSGELKRKKKQWKISSISYDKIGGVRKGYWEIRLWVKVLEWNHAMNYDTTYQMHWLPRKLGNKLSQSSMSDKTIFEEYFGTQFEEWDMIDVYFDPEWKEEPIFQDVFKAFRKKDRPYYKTYIIILLVMLLFIWLMYMAEYGEGIFKKRLDIGTIWSNITK